MSRRRLAMIGGVVIVFVVIVALLRLRPGDSSTSLETPWGEPDLQGIWTSDSEDPVAAPSQVCKPGVLHRPRAS
jgi:hypothetical protein